MVLAIITIILAGVKDLLLRNQHILVCPWCMGCLTVQDNRSKVAADCYNKRHNLAGCCWFFFFSCFLSCLLLSSCIYCPPDFLLSYLSSILNLTPCSFTLCRIKLWLICFSCPTFLWMASVYLSLIKFMNERNPLLLTNNFKENKKKGYFPMS